MMKIYGTVCLLCLLAISSTGYGQRLPADSGRVSFTVKAPAADLVAANDSLTGYLDATTGAFSFTVWVPGFQFISPAMPEAVNRTASTRFHNYYFNSHDYPEAYCKGHITGFRAADLRRPGTYPVTANALLSIHGQQKKLELSGTLEVSAQGIKLSSAFVLDARAYGIRIPASLGAFYYDRIQVSVQCRFVP